MAEAKAKETTKNSHFQESIILPEKFKEEDRVFLGTKEILLEEKERGVVSKVWGRAVYGSLKITLDHIEAMVNQNTVSEGALDQHIRYYLKKNINSTKGTLKCIAQMLIKRSRDRGQSPGIQVVLLFKAVDCLRMLIQYSPMDANNLTAFLILQIIARLPKAFIPHMNREKYIFNYALALQRAAKEKLPTINVRNKLANIYKQQKCFADALYQYEMILQYLSEKKPHTNNDKEKICVIHLNIGDLYKEIYEFKGDFKNGQILQNFIFRYNRDADFTEPSRTKISEISGPVNKMTVKEVYKDLKKMTVNHYEKAITFFPKNKNQKKKSETLTALGKSYNELKEAKSAATCLQDSLLLLGKERNSEEIFKEKEEILQIMRSAISKIPTGTEKEQLQSFVVKEENSLESDKLDWDNNQKKKKTILKGIKS